MQVVRLRWHTAKRSLKRFMNAGRKLFPASKPVTFASRNSFTSRSCRVLFRTSHAALRLAGVRAQDLDVEFTQGASELGHALTAGSLAVHAEDGVLVGVERDRAAVRWRYPCRASK